jgi:hypothetical protein
MQFDQFWFRIVQIHLAWTPHQEDEEAAFRARRMMVRGGGSAARASRSTRRLGCLIGRRSEQPIASEQGTEGQAPQAAEMTGQELPPRAWSSCPAGMHGYFRYSRVTNSSKFNTV